MVKGQFVLALIAGEWKNAVYEKPLTHSGREGQHLVEVDGGHAAIAAEVKRDMTRELIRIPGHIGTWYVLGQRMHNGKKVLLLEHEQFGEDSPSLITDENFNVILDDVHNGFSDLELHDIRNG